MPKVSNTFSRKSVVVNEADTIQSKPSTPFKPAERYPLREEKPLVKPSDLKQAEIAEIPPQ